MVKPMLFSSDLHSRYVVMMCVAKKVIVFFRGPRGCGDNNNNKTTYIVLIQSCSKRFTKILKYHTLK